MLESFRHKIRSALAGWELALGNERPGFSNFVRLNQKSLEGLTDAVMPAVEACIQEALAEFQMKTSKRAFKVSRYVADEAPAPTTMEA